uniref:Uncharacterized protein n=1 Tax=Brassica oleracea var. oleracea TaxID=109376 RepID=A0A0D3E4I7_BRAOL
MSLVEIHSSVGNLHKLERLEMGYCGKLQVVPSLFNLASLETVGIVGCYQLRKLPDISATITELGIIDTMLEEFTASIRLWSRLQFLTIVGSANPYQLMLERSGADIERIPDCIEFNHRAIGNSLTISSKAYGFRMCVIVSPKSEMEEEDDDGSLSDESFVLDASRVDTIADLHGSLQLHDASRLETTDDDLLDASSTSQQQKPGIASLDNAK